jgi:hypothetical protein
MQLRRFLVLSVVCFAVQRDGLRRAAEYFACDVTKSSGLVAQLCIAPEWRVDELARQIVHLLVLAYLMRLYLAKAAR